MEASPWLQERLRQIDVELRNNTEFRHELRGKQAAQDTRQAVVSKEVEGIREDIGELKEQGKWVIRGLVAATITFTGLIITILSAFLNG